MRPFLAALVSAVAFLSMIPSALATGTVTFDFCTLYQ